MGWLHEAWPHESRGTCFANLDNGGRGHNILHDSAHMTDGVRLSHTLMTDGVRLHD